MIYCIRVNENTMRAAVHVSTCAVVTGRQPPGFVVWPAKGSNAAAIARAFDKDEQLAERGLRLTRVCECAK